MSVESNFFQHKKNAISKLEKAKKQNFVDKDIMPILNLINNVDEYYTSSSCYGRIVLLQLPCIGDKKNAVFLGKWHRKIRIAELLEAAKKSDKGQIWLLAQSPIIHVGAKTLDDADKILKLAIGCGFKNSGVKTLKGNIIVEICSTERLDFPIGKDSVVFCGEDHFSLLVDISNNVLQKSADKLNKFKKKLIEFF